MSIAVRKYKVVAHDKNGNLVCNGITTDESIAISVWEKLKENGYETRLYDIIPVVGY